jgi:hypothetical protein
VYLGKFSLSLFNFGPEKCPLDVVLLWKVFYVVALPIGDGLQPPHQGLHGVHHVLPPLKSCSKSDLIERFTDN